MLTTINMDYKRSEIIVVNSWDRDLTLPNTTSTYFRINFNSAKRNVAHMTLVSATIPCTYYNIFQHTINGQLFQNNIIDLYEVLGGLSVSFILQPSSYDMTSLLAHLASRLTFYSPNAQTYTCTYDPLQLKISITNTTGGTEFELHFSNTPGKNPSYMLGFDTDQNSTTSVGYTLTGPNAANLGYPYYSVIKVQPVQSYVNNLSGLFGLFKVDLNANGGNIVYYNDQYYSQNTVPISKNAQDINYFLINLCDDYLNNMDLNGQDWSFTLRLDYFD